jgi:hypothetical protein
MGMGFNPFGTVDSYPSMLNKIATFTFIGLILAVWLLREVFGDLDAFLKPLNVRIPIQSGLSIPLGTLLPAFVIALLSRIFKLHDRLSDLLGIRKRFDVSDILFPLALGCFTNLSPTQIRRIRNNRQDLMQKVFYKYVSSSPGSAVIDQHYIIMALDQWCWYWIVLELSALAFMLAMILLIGGKYLLAALLFLSVLIATSLLFHIRKLCSDYAMQEIEQIIATHVRRESIAEEFRAL